LLLLTLICQVFSHIPFLQPDLSIWVAMMILYFVTLLISIPTGFYSIRTLSALSKMPLLMVSMVRAVFQMKKKRTEFIHTPKSFLSGDDRAVHD